MRNIGNVQRRRERYRGQGPRDRTEIGHRVRSLKHFPCLSFLLPFSSIISGCTSKLTSCWSGLWVFITPLSRSQRDWLEISMKPTLCSSVDCCPDSAKTKSFVTPLIHALSSHAMVSRDCACTCRTTLHSASTTGMCGTQEQISAESSGSREGSS